MVNNDVVFSGHQPNFLPYMGFFYKMFRSDVFVLDDDVQYSSKAYHNTNYIKVNGSKCKMTVPVSHKYGDQIKDVKICYSRNWVDKLLKTVKMNYGKSPCFDVGYELLERNLRAGYEYLADLNISLLREISHCFGFGCHIVISSKEVPTQLRKNDRNIFQCLALGGTTYYSGIGGKEYNDTDDFQRHGIKLVYTDYQPVHYKQVGKEFVENLSVIDYIFNQGYQIPGEWGNNREE